MAFEGQAAIELEAIADSTETGRYASPWQEQADGVMIIPSASMKQPPMKKKNMTTIMIAQGGSGRLTTQLDSTLGMVVTARKWPKTGFLYLRIALC